MKKDEFMTLMEKSYDAYKLDFEQIFMFKLLQMDFNYKEEDRTCIITCPVTDLMLNPGGIVHGGIYTFIADSAMGHLLKFFKGVSNVSLELKTTYYKAISEGEIRALARFEKEGNKVSFLECEITNEKGEPLAKTTGTFYRPSK